MTNHYNVQKHYHMYLRWDLRTNKRKFFFSSEPHYESNTLYQKKYPKQLMTTVSYDLQQTGP